MSAVPKIVTWRGLIARLGERLRSRSEGQSAMSLRRDMEEIFVDTWQGSCRSLQLWRARPEVSSGSTVELVTPGVESLPT